MTGWADGLDLEPLADGMTPIEGVLILKCLDEEGEVCLVQTTTKALTVWEALGMTISTADDLRAALRRCGGDDE